MTLLTHAPSRATPATPAAPATVTGTGTGPSLRHLGPNWYAVVMGTAIVANAGAALPLAVPGLRRACDVAWALSAVLLVALLGARSVHWIRHGDHARRQLGDPRIAPFYGCLSMALLAVGAGTLTVGPDLIGAGAALTADAALWTAGTLVGLTAAAGIPYLMVTRHRIAADGASPVWLLPLVSPMVAAANGPALAVHLPAGPMPATLLTACYAMFGMSLLMTLLVLPLVLGRLFHHGPLPLALTPTLFLVLGPLGQSTTAVHHLAVAAGTLAVPSAPVLAAFAVLYGVPVMGFALLWLAFATAMTVRAVRGGMGFAMTWWAFTFPIGTCVTGAAGLARQTGLAAFGDLAVALFAVLVAAVAVAGTRTALGLVRGELLAPPAG